MAAGGPGAGRRPPGGRTRPAGPGRIGGAGRPAGRGAGAAVARCSDRAHLPGAAGAGGRSSPAARSPPASRSPTRTGWVPAGTGGLGQPRSLPARARSCAGHDPLHRPTRRALPRPSSGRCWWIRRASGGGWASAGRLSRRTTSTLPHAERAAANRRLLRELGTRPIPPEQLARIGVPTALIWGRHDRVMRLRIAEEASAPLRLAPARDRGRRPLPRQPTSRKAFRRRYRPRSVTADATLASHRKAPALGGGGHGAGDGVRALSWSDEEAAVMGGARDADRLCGGGRWTGRAGHQRRPQRPRGRACGPGAGPGR